MQDTQCRISLAYGSVEVLKIGPGLKICLITTFLKVSVSSRNQMYFDSDSDIVDSGFLIKTGQEYNEFIC